MSENWGRKKCSFFGQIKVRPLAAAPVSHVVGATDNLSFLVLSLPVKETNVGVQVHAFLQVLDLMAKESLSSEEPAQVGQ